MSYQLLPLFISTVFIASIIPGPSMLLALNHGMQFGVKKTLASAMGNLTVTLIQASISFAGLGAILTVSESAFYIVKFAGAAYLIYLGVQIFFTPSMSTHKSKNSHSRNDISLTKMFTQAAIVTAGNPKAIVFFTAVFPQFINPSSEYLFQYLLLISIGSLIAFSCFMLYAFSGQKIVLLFSESSISKKMNKIIGGTFIGAGIGLALSGR